MKIALAALVFLYLALLFGALWLELKPAPAVLMLAPLAGELSISRGTGRAARSSPGSRERRPTRWLGSGTALGA